MSKTHAPTTHRTEEMARFSALGAPIRFFTHHPTAANLLMILLCVFGLLALQGLNTQLLPTRENPRVSIRVSWPGASASDMERAVVRNLEPALRNLDGVEDFFGLAREGSAYMAVQFRRDMDPDAVLQEVQKAVDGVSTLPADIDPPKVSLVRGFERVAKILVTGPYGEETLKAWALRIRDGLLAAGIGRVTLTGARDTEITVSVPERNLLRYRLNMDDIGRALSSESRDVPAGNLRGHPDRSVHGAARADTPEEIRRIPLRVAADGGSVTVGSIADVREGPAADQVRGYHRGQPAIRLEVQRTPEADTLETNRILHEFMKKFRPTMPPGLKVEIYDVRADYLIDRIWLLIKNGLQGLVIALVVLMIFLDLRIALWVALGIPVSMLTTLAVMWATGQSINMFSLFALIMVLGIIVDDAIVVTEHATHLMRNRHYGPAQAAETASLRMLAPVLAASLTTIAAFIPLYFFTGRIGYMLKPLPVVVTAALVASLVECFFILPAHLRHGLKGASHPGRMRKALDAAFDRFGEKIFMPLVRLACTWRYATLALVLAGLIMSIGVIRGGHLRFDFFPSPEPEYISASIVMQPGTPSTRTLEVLQAVEEALRRAERKLGGGEKLVHTTFGWLGKLGYTSGNHLAQLDVQLVAAEKRSVRTPQIIRAWKQAIPPLPGLEQFSIGVRRHGGAPRDLEIRLHGDDPFTLKRAALEIERILAAIPGVQSVDDDLPWGKDDVRIHLNQKGRALGLRIEDVGRQVRQALEGEVIRRFARDGQEIVVRLRRTGLKRGLEGLNALLIRTSSGAYLPLRDIATLTIRRSFHTIFRRDGRTTIVIGADLDPQKLTLNEALASVKGSEISAIAKKYGVSLSFAGGMREQREGLSDLQKGMLLALVLIYIILAWVLGSYGRPLVIMTIIPFGIIGMVIGHLLLGMNLTMLSLVGLLGLSGIIINDSIILVARADERMRKGEEPFSAATGAARDRLHAVILTTLTTIGGLIPLLFEKSIQAQFLIPMAVTIIFGLGLGTLLVLFITPAVYLALGDIQSAGSRLMSRASALLSKAA